MNRLDELVEDYSLSSSHCRWSMPVIFLSGAMTGLSELEQKKWRKYFIDHFEGTYYIIDPTVFDAEDEDKETQELGHVYDLYGIINCDYFIVNLNKAVQSVGTCQEIMFAWLLKKPIIGFWESKDLVQPLHPWIENKLTNKMVSIDTVRMYLQLEYSKRKAKELRNE